jgi:hypothetical protein
MLPPASVFFGSGAQICGTSVRLLRAADVAAARRSQMNESHENTQTTDVCDLRSKPIETLGAVFSDGCFIEPVHDPADQDALQLMLFDGETVQIAPRVEHRGRVYVARDVAPSIVRELHLPTEIHADGSVAQLFSDLVRLIQRLMGLPDNLAKLVARIPLSTWVMDARTAAPSIMFVGPDCRELTQLFNLLKCLCRHALLLTEVSAGGLYSLPMEMGLTLLIDQPELSEPVQRILNAARKSENKIPRRGNLWRPFCSKAVHAAGYFTASMIDAVKIPILPTGPALPVLDNAELIRIAHDFQPRLLSYRFANHGKVQASKFDNSICDYAMRESINILAACTPENPDLQAEIVGIVAHEAAEVRQERWTDPPVVLVESLLMACHTPGDSAPYFGKIADIMATMFSARGEERSFKPNQVGTMIRRLGFTPEPRDSQGVKLLLTEDVRRKIHQLARDFAVPSVDNRIPGCPHCADLDKNAEQTSGASDATASETE